jgi:hypothetical protein
MKEAAEPQAAVAPAPSAPARAASVPGAVGLVMRMQTTHGNAHVARLLAQQRAGVLGRMPIRRGAGHGSLAEAETAQVYEQPNESSKVVGELAKGKTVDLTSDDGGFYGVVVDGTKGYVKSSELATTIDELPAAKDAEFAARAKAAGDAIDAAAHAAGKACAARARRRPPKPAARSPIGSASCSSNSRWSRPGRRRRRPPNRSSTIT